ncbi:MAG: OsmC family protein [Salinivirgaceae bacterium]|nr:OsmC family protein [Salinivirgaceae bacterium]MDY0279581.1 OsmC family protein [Salinivirgaceae bacterium]
MKETIKTIYLGELRTEAEHVQSGNKLITDAPTDNHGKGEFFSPTDMLATSLTSCILTIMGINAEAEGFDIKGATAKTWKIMAENPRRVAEIKVEFNFTNCSLNTTQQQILKRLVKVSPVPLSLHADLIQNISLKF